jgi:hypothetical protein
MLSFEGKKMKDSTQVRGKRYGFGSFGAEKQFMEIL